MLQCIEKDIYLYFSSANHIPSILDVLGLAIFVLKILKLAIKNIGSLETQNCQSFQQEPWKLA